MRYIVIMAGGSGTRLWPLSRRRLPKQLLALIDGKSLLRLAYERARDLVPADRIYLCTARDYSEVIAAQLPELPATNLLGEPAGRDSLAAAAWSTAVIARRDPEATVAVLSADHVIEPLAAFSQAMGLAFGAAEADPQALVTLGVVPTSPQTGFGYIHFGAEAGDLPGVYQVRQFAEKPAAALAQRYLDEGTWWWNSGTFCWPAAGFLRLLAAYRGDTARAIAGLVAQPGSLDEVYPQLEKISLDYAIMEPASNDPAVHLLTVPLTANWADIGGYPALGARLATQDGNAVLGRVVTLDSAANLLINTGGSDSLIAVAGLRDTIVVQTGNIVLVCPRQSAESVKQLVDQVRLMAGPEFT